MNDKNYVALFMNGEYILGYINDYGIFSVVYEKMATVKKSEIVTRDFLENIPNVGYIENDHTFSIYDKRESPYELTVPVIARVFKDYRATKQVHTFKMLSDEGRIAAISIMNVVEREIMYQTHKHTINCLNDLLEENSGIAFVFAKDFPDISTVCNLLGYQRLWYNMGMYVIGDPERVKSLELKLYVPEDVIPFVVGKGGRNVKVMARIMRVNRISVLSTKNVEVET